MEPKTKKVLMLICRILFVIYMCVLIYLVFLSDGYNRVDGYTEYRYNLIPFTEIKRFYHYWQSVGLLGSLENILGNVVAFIPFGALIRWVRDKKTSVFVAVGSTFLLSLLIEIVQLVTRIGVFDVDDLMLNTLGGLIGYAIYFILASIDRKRKKKKEDMLDEKEKSA